MRLKCITIGVAVCAFRALVVAQRPPDTPICDYYTTALLKENTAANQLKLLTLVVNTAVIGNYTTPNVGIQVSGILAQGASYNDTPVNLLPYFNGELASTNNGGDKGEPVNFLDGGGAEPLKNNMPASDTTSKQYFLLTHLYQFFGVLLGCTLQGKDGYPAYGGDESMYETHKFMDLDPHEMGYFITQVGLSAASFGVAKEDVQAVGSALNKLFNYRCSPPTTVVLEQGPRQQSLCIAPECPLDPMNTCSAYDRNGTAVMPVNATVSGAGNSNVVADGGNSSSSASSPSSSSASSTATSTATSSDNSTSTATPSINSTSTITSTPSTASPSGARSGAVPPLSAFGGSSSLLFLSSIIMTVVFVVNGLVPSLP